MKDLLTLMDLSKTQIKKLVDFAEIIKKNPQKYSSSLKNKTIALLFQKTSTRTRISFEGGINQMGGGSIYLNWITTNLHLGSLPDEMKCISLYVDLIVARVFEHTILEIMSKASKVPVVNGLSDKFHPCQILADLLTIKEKFGTFNKVNTSWVGDGNNVCNSFILGCAILNIPITVATPPGYEPHEEVINWIHSNNKQDLLTLTNDPKKAVREANVIYTDTFVSMGQEDEKEKRLDVFKPYQINKKLLSYTQKAPFIMHCLPAHRGVEITDEVLDSDQSIVFQQAENRLHLQKALMISLLK
ncbi:MAG: Ornithine carbamoyltransferase [Promethearchaeota archaeon]|nr:MAG: Ornithine carbamoyltransferase [Candidatus Lokiarchaeota archaeon]